MNVTLRDETDTDRGAVFALNTAAFATDAEARLVDALRVSADPLISLVAEKDDVVVGHIMFSPVSLESHDGLRLMGLAPMAVSPALQRRGIGTRLVEAGLDRCRDIGCAAVAVLGHPEYYPRFGFRPSAAWGIDSEYDVAEEAFMLLELAPGCLDDRHGVIRYHAAFAGV